MVYPKWSTSPYCSQLERQSLFTFIVCKKEQQQHYLGRILVLGKQYDPKSFLSPNADNMRYPVKQTEEMNFWSFRRSSHHL